MKKTLKLIDGSIDKWKGIIKGAVGDDGVDNCTLCREFISRECASCPIVEYSVDYRWCGCTPYGIWINVCEELYLYYPIYAETKELVKLANHELSFLYEVRLFWVNRMVRDR